MTEIKTEQSNHSIVQQALNASTENLLYASLVHLIIEKIKLVQHALMVSQAIMKGQSLAKPVWRVKYVEMDSKLVVKEDM